MPKHEIGLTFKTDAGSVPISTIVYSIDSEINEAIPVPAGGTVEVDITFAYLQVHDYCFSLLNAAGTGEATLGEVDIYWNNSTTGVPQMNVVAKKPVFYTPDTGTTQRFTADITKGYFKNVGTTDVIVACKVGLNAIV